MAYRSDICKRHCNQACANCAIKLYYKSTQASINRTTPRTRFVLATYRQQCLGCGIQVFDMHNSCQNTRKQRNLCLFHCRAVSILSPLTHCAHKKTRGGNKYIFVIMNGYCYLTKPILTAKMTATRTVNIFMEHLVLNCGVPPTVLIDSQPQTRSKSFAVLCKDLGLKTVVTIV